MDPITIFAALSAAYSGIKKAVDMGKEAQDIFGQLGKWAKHASDLHDFIKKTEKKSGGSLEGNDTQEALYLIAAKSKLIQMENEIRQMFIYGELQHLGLSGYNEFVLIRRRIREDKERAERERIRKRKEAIEQAFWYSILSAVLVIAGFLVYLVYQIGVTAGRW